MNKLDIISDIVNVKTFFDVNNFCNKYNLLLDFKDNINSNETTIFIYHKELKNKVIITVNDLKLLIIGELLELNINDKEFIEKLLLLVNEIFNDKFILYNTLLKNNKELNFYGEFLLFKKIEHILFTKNLQYKIIKTIYDFFSNINFNNKLFYLFKGNYKMYYVYFKNYFYLKNYLKLTYSNKDVYNFIFYYIFLRKWFEFNYKTTKDLFSVKNINNIIDRYLTEIIFINSIKIYNDSKFFYYDFHTNKNIKGILLILVDILKNVFNLTPDDIKKVFIYYVEFYHLNDKEKEQYISNSDKLKFVILYVYFYVEILEYCAFFSNIFKENNIFTVNYDIFIPFKINIKDIDDVILLGLNEYFYIHNLKKKINSSLIYKYLLDDIFSKNIEESLIFGLFKNNKNFKYPFKRKKKLCMFIS